MVSDGEVRVVVQDILRDADLNTTTSRKVRKEVAARLELTEVESESIKSIVEVRLKNCYSHLLTCPSWSQEDNFTHRAPRKSPAKI
jgi:hypothetical protein